MGFGSGVSLPVASRLLVARAVGMIAVKGQYFSRFAPHLARLAASPVVSQRVPANVYAVADHLEASKSAL